MLYFLAWCLFAVSLTGLPQSLLFGAQKVTKRLDTDKTRRHSLCSGISFEEISFGRLLLVGVFSPLRARDRQIWPRPFRSRQKIFRSFPRPQRSATCCFDSVECLLMLLLLVKSVVLACRAGCFVCKLLVNSDLINSSSWIRGGGFKNVSFWRRRSLKLLLVFSVSNVFKVTPAGGAWYIQKHPRQNPVRMKD